MTITRNDITYLTPVQRPKGEGYNLLIGNSWYRTVAQPGAEIVVGTQDSLAPRQDDQGSIYQNVLDLGYAWGRTDLSGGEGLDWSPRQLAVERDEAGLDELRYWQSLGIDVRRPNEGGERYAIKLEHGTELWGGTPTAPVALGASDSFIYIADGATVSWYNAWDNLTASGSDSLAGPTNVVAMAVSPQDAVLVVGADGDGYMKDVGQATFTKVYTSNGTTKLEAKGCWFVNGRFLLATFDDAFTSQLWEIAYDGTTWEPAVGAEIDTARAPFWSVVDSTPAIVAAVGDGTLRTYTPDTADPALPLIPQGRISMPVGEQPILLGANLGVLLIMTTATSDVTDRQNLRLYQAEVLDARFNFVVGGLQLKREWVGDIHAPLVTRNMENTRDAILFFVKEELEGVVTSDYLWRFDLVTSGLSRAREVPNADLNSLVKFDNITGAINTDNNTIVLTDFSTYQASGWLIFPNITFGLNTPISWIATIIEADNLIDAGAQVELWRSSNPEAIQDWQDPSWVLVQRIASQGGSNLEIPLVGIKSRTLALQLRMFSSQANTRTPLVTRVALRGIPAHRDSILIVPVNVSDYISVPGRKPTHIPGLGHKIHEELLNLVGTNVELELIDPYIRMRAVLNGVQEPVAYQTPRGSLGRYCMVEFRGQRLVTGSVSSAVEGMGINSMGITTMGLDSLE